MNTLLQDVKYALRLLAKSPGFAAIAVLTLALGIGANTAIFSFTDQVLLRTLPVPNPQRLVVLRSPGPNPGRTSSDIFDSAQIFSYPMYKDLRERSSVFSGLLACFAIDVNVSGHGSTQSASGELVSGNYFQTLEVQPELGRVFDASDETAAGGNPVAVLSYGYWTRKFGADPSILDKPLTVNGTALTVVGVARKGFDGVQIGSLPDIFIPITMLPRMASTSGLDLAKRTDHWVSILGRLKPGMSRAQAQASLQPIYAPLLEEDAKLLGISSARRKSQFLSKPLQLTDGSAGRQVLQHDAQEPLLVLMGMVGLVLVITCANLASLLVARGEVRQREIAVRLALGAGRHRVVRQLLTESLIIGAAGGAAGVAMASWCLNTMVAAIPADTGMTGLTAALDPSVLWFAAAVTIGTSVLFGLAPALRATRVNLQATLKDQGSSVSEGRSNIRLRKVLIISQVALTAVLLAGAGLLARTLANLEHANLGVRTENILQFTVEPNLNGETPAQTWAFGERARKAMGALPGVRSVTVSCEPIFSDSDSGFNITPEGYVIPPDENTSVLNDCISPNYFSTMGIPLVAGREFADADTSTSHPVVIINQALAKRFFAGRNPIGMHITRGQGKDNKNAPMEIVGVVADSKWDSPRSDIVPFLYYPYSQNPGLGAVAFYVRTERDPGQMAATIHEAVAQLDSNLPVNDLRTLTTQIDNTMFSDRLVAVLSVTLAMLAALLAALGLYSVLAYVVARRTREIGIRMALGGQQKDILRLILGQGAWLTLIGGAIGIAAALGVTQLLSSELFGIKASDPLTFIGVAVLLVVVSGAACYLPARRAMKVDPMVALRYE